MFNNIKDYSYIKNLEKLETLNIVSNINDISFLENTINIKVLNLEGCSKIRDFSYIKYAEKLEVLNLQENDITHISFLATNKYLKKLYLTKCQNI